MAVLPTTRDLGRRPTPRNTRSVALLRGGDEAAQATQELGNAAVQAGEFIQDREDTAAAKERDAYVSEQIRGLLYDPERGFMNQYGKDAVGARARIMDQISRLETEATKGLSKSAARKLSDTLRSRLESARQRVDVHTSGERRSWLNQAGEARIEAATQDAIYGDVTQAFGVIAGELRQRADREGWDQAKLDNELGQAKSTLIFNQALQMARNNPVEALEFVEQNAGEMQPSQLFAARSKLELEAKEYQGRKLGADAYSASLPNYQHQTQFEYSMGPKRPYKPDAPVMNVIGAAVQDVLGPGAKVIVVSGQEGDNPQHGSNRHKTGNAADVAIIRPNGTRVLATDPEMQDIARASARRGARGIGFGAEYMGGEHVHIDLVSPGAGQSNTWASGGKGMREELVGIMSGDAPSLDGILSHPDPDVRDAALREYKIRQEIDTGRQKAALKNATDTAFQYIEAGGDPADLDLDVRQALGMEAMSALRTYYGKATSNEPITTDPKTYVELRRLQAQDPEGFRSLNIAEYADRLSITDLKGFADAQFKPATEQDEWAASSLMSTAQRQLRAAGVDSNSEEEAQVQTRLLKWQAEYMKANGSKPTQKEIDERVGQELKSVVADPSGYWNRQKGQTFSDNLAEPISEERFVELMNTDGVIQVEGVGLPADVVGEIMDILTREGERITYQSIASKYLDLRADFNG